jgi:hypothetical protein
MEFLSTSSFTEACVLEGDDGGNGAAQILQQMSSPPRLLKDHTETAVFLASMKKENHCAHPSEVAQNLISSPVEISTPVSSPGVTSELEFDLALDLINIHKKRLPSSPPEDGSASRVCVSPSCSEFSGGSTVAPARKPMYNTFKQNKTVVPPFQEAQNATANKRGRPPRKLVAQKYRQAPTSPMSRKSTPLAQAALARKREAAAENKPGPTPTNQMVIIRRGFDVSDDAPTVVRMDGGVLVEYKPHRLRDTIRTHHPYWTPTEKIDEKNKDIHFEILPDGWLIPMKEDLDECPTARHHKAFVTFYLRLNELRQYIQHYGDANVPQQFPPAHSLGIWVNKMRMEKKKFDAGQRSNLTQRKVDLLEQFGFIWAQNCKGEGGWQMRFEELKKFKKMYGHCDVPTKCDKNRALGRWVSTQRAMYKVWVRRTMEVPSANIGTGGRAAGLDLAEIQRRITSLEEIGFNFSKLSCGETQVKSTSGAIVVTYLDKSSAPKRKQEGCSASNEAVMTKKRKTMLVHESLNISDNPRRDSPEHWDHVPSITRIGSNDSKNAATQSEPDEPEKDHEIHGRNNSSETSKVDIHIDNHSVHDANKENDNRDGDDKTSNDENKSNEFEIENGNNKDDTVCGDTGSNVEEAKKKEKEDDASKGCDAFFDTKEELWDKHEHKGTRVPLKKGKDDGHMIIPQNQAKCPKERAAITTKLVHLLERIPMVGRTRSARETPSEFLQRLINFVENTTFGTEHQATLHSISRAVDENEIFCQTRPLWGSFHAKVSEMFSDNVSMK